MVVDVELTSLLFVCGDGGAELNEWLEKGNISVC